MSENYIINEGYRPLALPVQGSDLQVGRQYVLTPLVRLILADEYGFRGIPTVVECIRAQRGATRLIIKEEHLSSSGEVIASTERIEVREAQRACFSCYTGNKKFLRFEVEIDKLEALAPFYDKSHKLPAFEADWFKHASAQQWSSTRFRGQRLRWWAVGDSGAVASDGADKAPATKAKRTVSVDTSLLFD